MAESVQSQAQNAKPKPKSIASGGETGKNETPHFEIPKMEIPVAFREIAEKGIAQAKENYDKMKSIAEDATDRLENTYATASKGCTDYGLKLIEHSRANSNAAFDLFGDLLTAKSFSEVIELSTAYWRQQFDTATAQVKELSEQAQRIAAETTEPLKEGFTNAFRKVA
jgi:phasin